MPLWMRIFQIGVRGLAHLLFRVRVRGLRNVPRAPVIICSNHLSWLDPFLVLIFFPPEPRIYALADAHAVSATGFRKRMTDALGMIVPVNPANTVQALLTMRGILDRGGSLQIMPEGFSQEAQEGQLGPLQPGAAFLSVATGVLIVPVGFTGTKELWLRRPVTMRIGKPLDPATITGSRRERVDALNAQLAVAIKALLPGDQTRPRVKLLRNWLTNLFA